MPQQTDSASRTRLCRINSQLTGRKLRVAGRVLTYDFASGFVVLLDGSDGLYVDVTLALDSRSNLWATERLSTVMAIGDLEHSDVPLQRPIMPMHSPIFKISQHLILRAILVVSTPDLDLSLWNAVLEEDEDSLDKT